MILTSLSYLFKFVCGLEAFSKSLLSFQFSHFSRCGSDNWFLLSLKHVGPIDSACPDFKKSIKKILTAESTRLLVCFSARNTGEQGSALHSFSKITSTLFLLLIMKKETALAPEDK